MSTITKRSKITLTNFEPKEHVAELKGDTTSIVLGSLIGVVIGVGETKGPNGVDVFTFLKGNFELVPSDPKADTIQSGKLFMPEGLQGDIETMFDVDPDEVKAGRQDPAPERVQFAYEVSIVKDGNPQGYAWSVQSLTEPGENDPLAELRAQLPKPAAQKQVADKTK